MTVAFTMDGGIDMKKLSLLLLLPASAMAAGLTLQTNSEYKSDMPQGTAEFLQQQENSNAVSIKRFGYIEEDSIAARFLMEMKNGRNLHFTLEDDTNLKKNLKDLKLSFKFKDIPGAIAYSPLGSRSDKGWSGVKVFFNTKDAGFCAYSYMYIDSTHMTVKIDKSQIKTNVNEKPLFNEVSGSVSSGFVYSVNWYDKGAINMLDCVNEQYDVSINQKVINQVKQIEGVKK